MSIKEHLNNGYVIVLDTNVLLNVYRYSPEFSEFALECLKAIGKHIVLPSTVRLEYDKHCRGEFSRMERRIAEASKETEKQVNGAKIKIINSCQNLRRLQFPDIEELEKGLSKKTDELLTVLNSFFEDHKTLQLIQQSWNGTDLLLQFIQGLDAENKVMDEPSQEDLYRWCEEGEKRYNKEIPPGFKDAKNKDGIRKYSDLILWNETLRYAKEKSVNVVFVTDDVKLDWWEYTGSNKAFHKKLVEEFGKTGQQLVAMTSQEFFSEIAIDYSIEKSDAVEIALRMTDEDYCLQIADEVFDDAQDDLVYNAIDYIETESANIGSEGIDEYEVTDYEFDRAERVSRNDSVVNYEFIYNVTIEGTSYDYWGRDEDTKEVIRSNGRDHVFEGYVVVQVEREVEAFYDFEDDNSYETAVVIDGKLTETSFSDRMEGPGEFGFCPECGCPLNIDNDAGTGFCIDCENKRDF